MEISNKTAKPLFISYLLFLFGLSHINNPAGQTFGYWRK